MHDDAPITGHTVDKVEARGKHVLMWFSGSHYEYDAAIPTLTQVVGHDHGDEVTSPEEITTYLRALAAAAPARTRLVEYGRTWEGRPLHLLAIATPARIAQLDAITQDLRRLADPRTLSATETAALITRLDLAKAIEPIRELPTLVPGAIAHTRVDTEHWLSSGLGAQVPVNVAGQRIFAPITIDKGRNVVVYASSESLVASGIVWDESKQQLPGKPYLIHQPLGRGHVIAFAEGPNNRGFAEASQLLFINAVLLGPAQ